MRAGVTLVLLVGGLVGAAWFGWQSVLVADDSSTEYVCTTPTEGAMQRIAAADVTVNVYNASDIVGLADRTADGLRAQGFLVDDVGNAPDDFRDVEVAEIRGRSATAPEVEMVAHQMRDEERVPDGRTEATVDLIVGAEFAGLIDDAPTAVEVESTAPICRTVTPTPGDGAQAFDR